MLFKAKAARYSKADGIRAGCLSVGVGTTEEEERSNDDDDMTLIMMMIMMMRAKKKVTGNDCARRTFRVFFFNVCEREREKERKGVKDSSLVWLFYGQAASERT